MLAGLVPLSAAALGLGGIDLRSGLNQPFVAEIEVSSESADELTGLSVKLAARETFAQFGLDRALFLTDFEFAMVTRNGVTFIKITSVKPVIEPFVTLLLEIRWPQGRLLREYTVLLDPPAFGMAEVEPAIQEPVAGPEAIPEPEKIERSPVAEPAPEPAPESAQPAPMEALPAAPPVEAAAAPESARVEPVSAAPALSPTAPAESVSVPASAETESAAPASLESAVRSTETPPSARAVEPSRPAPVSVDEAFVAAESGDAGSSVSVTRGDTLWAIAGRVSQGSAADRNQMMLAIYQANPEAFVGNINRLKAGKILRIPEADARQQMGPRAARIEVQRQIDEWKQATDEGARLRLVPPPEQAVDDSTAVQTGTSATSVDQETLQRRIAALEVELSDSQRLISIRDDDLQALQAQLAALQERLETVEGAETPIEGPVFADETDAEALTGPDAEVEEAFATGAPDAGVEALDEPFAQTEEAAERVSEPASPPAPIPSNVVTTPSQPEESSWIGALFTNVWLYVSLFAVLLLALFISRRRQGAEPPAEEFSEPVPDIDEFQSGISEISADFEADVSVDSTFIVEEQSPGERTIREDSFTDQPELSDQPELESESESDRIPDRLESELATDLDQEISAEPELADDDVIGAEEVTAENEIKSFSEAESEPAPDLDFDFEAESEPEPVPEPDFEAESKPEPEPEPAHDTSEDSIYESANIDSELPFERTISIASPTNLDEADPIAEADFHMAYGLYDQAASLLTDAIAADPSQASELRLKLVEVYFIWENASEFLKQAEMIKQDLDETDPDWNKVLIMGKQICPDEEIFVGKAGPPGKSAPVDLAFGDDAGRDDQYDVDIPLADASVSVDTDAPDVDIVEIGDEVLGGLDFDLGGDADDDGASTMETPTIESPVIDPTGGEPGTDTTIETPTVDIAALEPMADTPAGEVAEESAPTMETPTVDIAALEPTMETPTIKTEVALGQMDDGGLDFMMGEEDSDNEDLLSISSVDLTAETLQVEVDEDTELGQFDLGESADDDDFLNLEPTEVVRQAQVTAGDTVEQTLGSDTTQQPGISADTESPGEASTMTEVGTKLDLARAYIDMGDPDGARSILNEVIEEAGDSQRQEARQLLSGLG